MHPYMYVGMCVHYAQKFAANFMYTMCICSFCGPYNCTTAINSQTCLALRTDCPTRQNTKVWVPDSSMDKGDCIMRQSKEEVLSIVYRMYVYRALALINTTLSHYCHTCVRLFCIFNPRHMHSMRQGYGSVCLCVYLSVCLSVCQFVCYHASCNMRCLPIKIGVLQGYLWHFAHLQCVDLAKNALFKSYGVICLPLPRSTVSDQLSMNRSNSDGFFLRRSLRTFSDSSGKMTDSSLFVEKQILSFLACQLA